MQRAYRIAKAQYSSSQDLMVSGVGASMNGGRWNSRGNKLVYASDSRALATLEILVNLKNASILGAYSICEISIPDELCEEVGPEELPAGWDDMVVNPAEAQAWGDLWLDEGLTPAVKVPSVVVPMEWNFLLNPGHESFPLIQLGEISGFPMDSRIRSGP